MPTRVSTNQIFTGGIEHISRARQQEMVSAEKAQTNKEVNRPSDDSGAWVRAANMRDALVSADKIQRNAQIAQHFMTAAETALAQIQEYVQRTYELTVAAADTNTRRDAVLNDIRGLWDSVLQAMNARYGDRSLFAGYQTMAPAFDSEGKYLGDEGQIAIHIEANGDPIPISFSGERILLGLGLNEGVDIANTFLGLIDALASEDMERIQAAVPTLFKANEQISLGRAEVAGRMTQVSRALEAYGLERVGTSAAISVLEDADAYKVFSELARDQTIFQSVLATNKKVLTDAPVDILFK